MRVQITEAMVQTMSGLIECGMDASKVISAKMQGVQDELVMSLGAGVKQIQDDCEAGRA